MDSILDSIKKMIGIVPDDETFDIDLIIHINTVLSILRQIGVGPPNGFAIEDNSATWSDFMGDDPRLAETKTYVYLRVKTLFDTNANSSVMESLNRLIAECEWRLNVTAETLEIE